MDTIEVETKACPRCGQFTFLTVSKAGYEAWDNGRGVFIQVALPELSEDEREMLLTGYDPECWDVDFSFEEDPLD